MARGGPGARPVSLALDPRDTFSNGHAGSNGRGSRNKMLPPRRQAVLTQGGGSGTGGWRDRLVRDDRAAVNPTHVRASKVEMKRTTLATLLAALSVGPFVGGCADRSTAQRPATKPSSQPKS